MEAPTAEQKSRETVIAILLITMCLISMIVGLFLIRNRMSDGVDADGAKIVSSLVGDKVSVIALEGPIYESFEPRTPFSRTLDIANTKKELQKAIEDKKTKAVLLRVNSPGGTVAASQELYKLVKDIQDEGKPVVVSMTDVCASGCYYIASAANKIVASPGTLTGSIGVISHGINFTGLLQKLGLMDQTFKAGKYKDIASGQRTMTEEEKRIMQSLLDDSYDQFLADIETGRGIAREKLEEIAQGLIYTGRQALDVNLVDVIGTYEDAKNTVREVLEEDYDYTKSSSIDFDETWITGTLSGFEDIFDFGLTMPIRNSVLGFIDSLGISTQGSRNAHEISFSKYQPLWMMP